MKLLRYIQSLLPNFERKTMEDNLKSVRKELTETIIPHYERSATLLANAKFKDSTLQRFERDFSRNVKTRHRGNYVQVISRILPRLVEITNSTERMVEQYFSRDVVKSSLTYSRAQIIQLVEALDFATRYSRKLLILTVSKETAVLDNRRDNPMTSAEIKWLESHAGDFMDIMNSLDRSGKEVESIVRNIPDIEVDETNIDEVIRVSGQSSLNPLNLNRQGFRFNPIYHIRMMKAEWDVARYESSKEEKKLLEYEILDLENMMNGDPDPKLQKAIEYTRERVAKINKRIADMEK